MYSSPAALKSEHDLLSELQSPSWGFGCFRNIKDHSWAWSTGIGESNYGQGDHEIIETSMMWLLVFPCVARVLPQSVSPSPYHLIPSSLLNLLYDPATLGCVDFARVHCLHIAKKFSLRSPNSFSSKPYKFRSNIHVDDARLAIQTLSLLTVSHANPTIQSGHFLAVVYSRDLLTAKLVLG